MTYNVLVQVVEISLEKENCAKLVTPDFSRRRALMTTLHIRGEYPV
jgi:hypothetical protein